MKDFIINHPIFNSIILIILIVIIFGYIRSLIFIRKSKREKVDEKTVEVYTSDAKLMMKLLLGCLFIYILIFNLDKSERSSNIHTDEIRFNEWTGEPIYKHGDPFYEYRGN